MILISILEVIGIFSILPFIELASSSDSIQNNQFLHQIYITLQFKSYQNFLIALGITSFTLILFSAGLKILVTWLQQKFVWDISHEMGTKLLRIYLNRSYSFFINHNSSQILSNLIIESSRVTSSALLPYVQLMSTSVIAIIVVVFLFLMNVKVALICMGTFTMIFAAIYLLVKPILSRLSKQRVNANTNRFKNLKETVAGVKTFKVHNTLHYFYQRYEKVSHIISKIQPKVSLIGVAPKNLMDIILFGSIILFVLFFIISERDIKTAIPLLSVYAIAGYKLLPAIEQVFKAMVNIKHAESSIELLRKDFNSIENDIILPSHSERIDFLSTIQFDNVSYQYEGAHHPTLNKINFTILKGSKVAFVGETGSGKTTLIDILVGLLPPSQGRIYIDENMINDHNLISWQNNLCYVAQDVFLFDEDLEQNVALNKKSTSMEKLYKILDIVQLRDFVESLEHKHKTRVGEMGVKLSGGQKQRIGLARALYRNPEVLILDEATNALDVKTEKEFFQSLEKHFPDITLIIITHRLSTIKNLDCIYFLSHGKIIESGNYFELKSRNVHFNEMISIS